jgi:tRNA-dihydrouridine synthase B
MIALAPSSAPASALDRLAPYPVMLAPMVGLTHFIVRKALQEYLPPGRRALWPTEMLSSRRLPYQSAGQFIETRFDDAEAGLCPQLLGNEEGFIRDSIARLKDWGALAIDINMGCPVKKALKHNYGVALMGDPDYAAEIVSFAVKHSKGLPVSVKLRAAPPPGENPANREGDPDPEYLKAFCEKLQAAGASWLTLHPRTAVQKRRGDADWSQIASVKSWMRIPVVGNGDVQTVEDARVMQTETGCDRVMVGRALIAKPWLLTEVGTLPNSAPLPHCPVEEGARYARFLARVLELSREHYDEGLGVRKFKFLTYHGSPYLQYGHTLRAALAQASTYAELQARLNVFFGERFDRPQRMSATTALRG